MDFRACHSKDEMYIVLACPCNGLWAPTWNEVASTLSAFCQDGVETFLIERKMDNCKPCGGAIPLCMIDEFDLPKDIVDRQAVVRESQHVRSVWVDWVAHVTKRIYHSP